jgi:rhodanese-related sulfurtransferase
MRWAATLVCAASLLGAGGLRVASAEEFATSISPAQLHERQQTGSGPLIVDVRSPEEFAEGHIPGAVNIPLDEVAERVPRLDAPRGVALYCMVGPRARRAEEALHAVGERKLFHLDGGLTAWQSAGLPLAR